MGWKTKLIAIFLFAAAWSVYHESHVGRFRHTINIDGIGYNAYLPALFLHDGNLSWRFYDSALRKLPVFENRLQDFRKPAQGGSWVNKYPPGLAVTQLPFWLGAWLFQGASGELSGYETPFQVAVFINNLFWLFLGLWLFSLMLQRHGWPPGRILLLNGLVLFCTNVFHFITFDHSLTHPVTLGLSFCGFYFLDLFKSNNKQYGFYLFLTVLLLLFLLRPVNVLMVPLYLWYFYSDRSGNAQLSLRQWVISAGFMLLTLFLYFGDIRLQTGHWFVYSYQNEKFVFDEFHLADVLIGYRCGLFLYTPVLLVAIGFWFRNPSRRLVWGYLFLLLLVSWVVSTWNEYCYGCRLGNRPMMDYFAFFIIPLVGSDFRISNKWLRMFLILLLVFFTYYNQILHYQYRHYLLDWCDVSKEQYWEIFLRTHKPH